MSDLGPRWEAVALVERLGYRSPYKPEWSPIESGAWKHAEHWLGRNDEGVPAEIIATGERVRGMTIAFALYEGRADEFERSCRELFDYFVPGIADTVVDRVMDADTPTFDIERIVEGRSVRARGNRVGELGYFLSVALEEA